MRKKKVRYISKLTGHKKLEAYIEALIAHPAFDVKIIAKGEESIYEVYGPNKTDVWENEENIKSDLSRRSEKLGIHVPGLVEKVTYEIVSAQEGEKIAFERPILLLPQRDQGKSLIHVILDMELSRDPKIDECAKQYALSRLICLANSIGMFLEESPESTIIQ